MNRFADKLTTEGNEQITKDFSRLTSLSLTALTCLI